MVRRRGIARDFRVYVGEDRWTAPFKSLNRRGRQGLAESAENSQQFRLKRREYGRGRPYLHQC